MDWVELVGAIAALLVASGVGAVILAIVQHFLGKRTREVSDIAKIGDTWDQLVEELKADRLTLQKELSELRVWRTQATKQINSLEANDISKGQMISTLQDENERLARKVEVLTQENDHLSIRLTSLQDRIRILEEENVKLQKENDELRSVRST